MDLFEHQAKELFARYGVAIPRGRVAWSPEEAEEVAAATPEAIVRVPVNPLVGLRPYHVNQLVFGAGFDERARKGAAEILARLYDVLLGADCTLVEVNPLVLTADGQVKALDAKVSLDDSSLFRHPDLEALRDTFAVDPQE